jgi:hypothetical protein
MTAASRKAKKKHYIGLNPAEANKRRRQDYIDKNRPRKMSLKKEPVEQPVDTSCMHSGEISMPLELLDFTPSVT